MALGVDVCKTSKSKLVCEFCSKSFKKGDATLTYIPNKPFEITIAHLNCIFDGIEKNAPDFWKKYIVERL